MRKAPIVGSVQVNAMPVEFDGAFYRKRYADLSGLHGDELLLHYVTAGLADGRQASPSGTRNAFFATIPPTAAVLEIGPFATPCVKGRNVKYFDVLSQDELRMRASRLSLDPGAVPRIDFHSATGDLSIVDEEFDIVVSSHSIEHQPDLIRHLVGVDRILKSGGKYFLAIPDKRYCHDHFIPESTVAGVLSAHVRGLHSHDVGAVIEHRALTTHNDTSRHWLGDHGQPAYRVNVNTLRAAVSEHFLANGKYVDVHAWQFTPDSFAEIVRTLFDLHLIAFRAICIFPTLRDTNEFFAVLEKTAHPTAPIKGELPPGFDPELYLQVNPDVRAAGVTAELHYLVFGRHEGRKLGP